MKWPPIVAHRASVAIELRYNLFRHRWQPDLCCAVPEHHPVPGFITGERWDFGGAREAAAPPPGLRMTGLWPLWLGRSMAGMQSVIQVDTRQDREHVSLQGRNQELKGVSATIMKLGSLLSVWALAKQR
jgi:hypothetical protein